MELDASYIPLGILLIGFIYVVLDKGKRKKNRTPFNSNQFDIPDSPAKKARNKLIDAWGILPEKHKKYVRKWGNAATINNDLKTGNYAGTFNFRTDYIYRSNQHWLASVFVHEAAHNYINYKRKDLAGDRTAQEIEANRIQAMALDDMGKTQSANRLRKQDGTHWKNHNY